MNDKQLEKHLKKWRYPRPSQELRERILSAAKENWTPLYESSTAGRSDVSGSVFLRLTYLSVYTTTAAVVIVIALLGRGHLSGNVINQIIPSGILGNRISERSETAINSIVSWYTNSNEMKSVTASIKERFSIPEKTKKR